MNEDFYMLMINKAESYTDRHSPDTGYTKRVMRAVCDAARNGALNDGTNILVEFALLFDGNKTSEQQIDFSDEIRLPYGDCRSLDKSSDCSSWVENLFDLFFGIDIGTWTESQWKNLKSNEIPFEDMRPCDLIFWNFKSGRKVSHVALYIGNGRIIHTTGVNEPMRVETANYASLKRVGCVRPLSDEQYNSLIYIRSSEEAEGNDIEMKKGDISEQVGKLQQALLILGYNLGAFGPDKNGIDNSFGNVTETAVKTFQLDNGISVTGIADTVTTAAILAALSLKVFGNADSEAGLRQQINDLNAKIEAAKQALS